MLSFRNSVDFFLVAALAVTIVMLVRAHQTTSASGVAAFAAIGAPPVGDIKPVGFKPPDEHWFPRASTPAAETLHVNHEGF